jgi:hypothetical protein
MKSISAALIVLAGAVVFSTYPPVGIGVGAWGLAAWLYLVSRPGPPA